MLALVGACPSGALLNASLRAPIFVISRSLAPIPVEPPHAKRMKASDLDGAIVASEASRGLKIPVFNPPVRGGRGSHGPRGRGRGR